MCYMAFGSNLVTHSSILAWIIPWTEEPGELQSIDSQKVGHNWATKSFTYTCGGFILIFGKSNTFMLILKIK